MSQSRDFKMALLNINCLLKHVDELRTLMLHKPLNVLAINESKLSQNDSNDSVDLVGYTPEYHTKYLLDLMVNYQLIQMITEPTRINDTSKTLIDVFIQILMS